MRPPRLGVDLGGTKIEIAALEGDGELLRRRVPTPHGDYDGTVAAIVGLVTETEARLGAKGSLGVGIPGTVGAGGLVKNANSTWLNGRPLGRDLEAALARPVHLANDANCFTLSEARDGAGAGTAVVFGVILGTGVGGAVAVHGRVLEGAHGIAGEWGHNPLPGMDADEIALVRSCHCGKRGCIETWVSGPGLAADFSRTLCGVPGVPASLDWTAEQIAASDDADAKAAMARWTERLARGLASVVNILDPDVIVLGGGLSNIARLPDELSALVETHCFSPQAPPQIVRNRHGDSSGVRGAAWLWPADMP